MELSSIAYPCNLLDNTLFLTAFCSPSHFPCTPPSVFRDHLPSKLCALKSLSQGLPGELKPRHLGSSAHDYQESLGCSWPDSPCILLGVGSPAAGCAPHQEFSPALSAAWPGPRPCRVLGQKLHLWVRAFRAWMSMLEECILSPSALSADLSLSRGGGPAAGSKHTE